jgi:lipoprotein-releasing system ATP-binding protein
LFCILFILSILVNFSVEEFQSLLEAVNLSKEYPTPQGPLAILSDISLKLARGDAVSIMGPSGSGKSTLLYILGALEPPTAGQVTLDGKNPFELREKELAAFRNRKVGFIFQDHCLLPQCSVIENVLTPTLVAETDGDDVTGRARALLEQVGLAARIEHRPAELSGGEKQRVALARALMMKPLLLLCDEPTGNLDHKSAEVVASLLLELHKQQETILIIVTHSAELAARFPIQFELHEQQLVKK